MFISEVPKKVGSEIEIKGWVYRKRESKGIVFLIIRDSHGIVQCTIKEGNHDFKKAQGLTLESSVILKGLVAEDKRAPTGYEIKIKNLEPVHIAERFPITKDQSPELLLDMRHLWLRSRKLNAVMKVRSTVMEAFREFYSKQGYWEMAPPIFTPNACEGGSTLFEVKYYDKKVYLTQSWQLYAEAAIFSMERLFCISPCFRSEKMKTSRHLSEFWMAEMEAAWMELQELLKSAEECLAYIVKKVLDKNENELKLLGQDIEKLKKIKTPFPRITYTEALKILKEKEKMNVAWGKDFRTIEEDNLMKHFEKPLIVTNYPKKIMGFYKPVDPKDPKTCLCFDMLAPEGYGELIGGSQRSTDVKELIKSLKEQDEKPENYEWYLDLRKYGSIPHSGYGLGIERFVAWLCKLENIKDAIPFPRTMLRHKP